MKSLEELKQEVSDYFIADCKELISKIEEGIALALIHDNYGYVLPSMSDKHRLIIMQELNNQGYVTKGIKLILKGNMQHTDNQLNCTCVCLVDRDSIPTIIEAYGYYDEYPEMRNLFITAELSKHNILKR